MLHHFIHTVPDWELAEGMVSGTLKGGRVEPGATPVRKAVIKVYLQSCLSLYVSMETNNFPLVPQDSYSHKGILW